MSRSDPSFLLRICIVSWPLPHTLDRLDRLTRLHSPPLRTSAAAVMALKR